MTRSRDELDNHVSRNRSTVAACSWANIRILTRKRDWTDPQRKMMTRAGRVLAWDDARQGASDFHDGHNVVLHEFAHQLDQQDGSADGAPILEHRSQYVSWARVLSEDYEQLRRDAEHGRRNVLDGYVATNPAEFFAVATECFFEKPIPLRRKHPQLYEELKECSPEPCVA